MKKHEVPKVENKKNVAMDITLGGFEITPLGPNKIKFVGIANANPNVGFVPDSMINFVIRKVKLNKKDIENLNREQEFFLR